MENNILEHKSLKLTAKKANYIFFASLVLLMGMLIILGSLIFMYDYYIKDINEEAISYYYLSPIIEIIAIFLPLFIYFYISKVDYKKILRLNKLSWKHIAVLIVIGAAMQFAGMFFNFISIFILQFLGKVPSAALMIPENFYSMVGMLISMSLVPAIFEEILMRGVVLRGYESFGIKTAIIMSSLLFAILHFDLINFLFPLCLGLLLGYIVYRTNSLYSAIIVHLVNNGLGILFLYIMKPTYSDYYQKISLMELLQYLGIGIVAGIFIGGGLYYLYKTTSNENYDVETNDIVEREEFSYKKMFHWPVVVSILITLITFYFSIWGIIVGMS